MARKDEKPPRSTLEEVLAAIDKDEPEVERHLSIQLDDGIKAAVRASLAAQKKAEVQLKITVTPQGERRVQVSGAVSSKLPRPGTKSVVRFADDDGELFGSDPAQAALPGIKDFVHQGGGN